MQLTREEFEGVIEDDDTIEIEREKHHRHNMEYIEIVFKRDGKHFSTTYTVSDMEGIHFDEFPLDCHEVEPVSITTITWKAVK